MGHHAISVYNDGIYDANSKTALSLTRASLNWCCGDTEMSICVGATKAYQVLPKMCIDKPVLAHTVEHGYIWPMFEKKKIMVTVGCTKHGVTKMKLTTFNNNIV